MDVRDIDSLTQEPFAESGHRPDPDRASLSFAALPAFASASRVQRLLWRLAGLHVLLLLAAALPLLPARLQPHHLTPSGFVRGCLLMAVASLLPATGGLLATALIANGRAHTLRRPGSARLPALAGAPQAVLLLLCSLLALVAIRGCWRLLSAGSPVLSAHETLVIPTVLLIVSFLLLIGERAVAGFDRPALPEATGLAGMMRIPPLVLTVLALLAALAPRLPVPAGIGLRIVCLLPAAAAIETAVRTLRVWYAPRPVTATARACVGSLTALLLDARRLSPSSLGASLQNSFGIDFARSWALGFARRALLPVLLLMLLGCWTLTGTIRVGLNQRAVYERFGAPAAVLGPGLHMLLPWPLGRGRLVDDGVVHSILLADSTGSTHPADTSTAEGPAPASANRLWDQAADGSPYLIARADGTRQSFEAVSVDLRVLYRVGMSAADARDALYAVADPPTLIASLARRLLSRLLAGETLSDVLVQRHDQLAETLRRELQARLDQQRSGIEIVGLVVDALHPPAGAASAYRAVQAAEIAAQTSVATERGRARTTGSLALRDAHDARDAAQATAGETEQTALAQQTAMSADVRAWHAGGDAFLIERRFADLVRGLSHAPVEIIDKRLPPRLLDLRASIDHGPDAEAASSYPDQEGRSP